MAMGLQTTIWDIEKREDIKKNIDHVRRVLRASMFAGMELPPVKLLVLCEAALTGFPDSYLDLPHDKAAKELWPTIPGEETDILGEMCKQYGFYMVAQCKARDPDFFHRDDQYFNFMFIIDPDGKVIHRHRKTCVWPREKSICPTDVWEIFKERYGPDPKKLLEAVFPVAKTDIGNIGTLICGEGPYPEPARALALNGAEIIIWHTYVEPWVGNGLFEVVARSHAIFNSCYVISPNTGPYYVAPWEYKEGDHIAPVNSTGAESMIIDFEGRILSRHHYPADGFVSAPFYVDALRQYRVKSLYGNYLKDLRIEQYRLIYEAAQAIGGIFPKNLWLEDLPRSHKERDWIHRYVVNTLVERGIWTPPKDWEPYKIPKDVLELIEKAKKNSTTEP